MGEKRHTYKVLREIVKKRNLLEYVDVNERIILKYILKEYIVRISTGIICIAIDIIDGIV
jgi:predicted ATP-grasp superfamily ATP-dependent carboligase